MNVYDPSLKEFNEKQMKSVDYAQTTRVDTTIDVNF